MFHGRLFFSVADCKEGELTCTCWGHRDLLRHRGRRPDLPILPLVPMNCLEDVKKQFRLIEFHKMSKGFTSVRVPFLLRHNSGTQNTIFFKL